MFNPESRSSGENLDEREVGESKILKQMNCEFFDIDPEIPIAERPKKILELIVEHQKDFLGDLDINTKELRERGVSEEEIEMATNLMCAISYFDSIFFEKGIEMSFSLNYDPDNYAGYHTKESEEDQEAYLIFIKNLREKIQNRNNRVVSFDSSGKLNFLDEKIEEFMLGLAAHEVRHRLQGNDEQEETIKLFDRNKKYPEAINNFVKFKRLYFIERAKEMGEEDIKDKLSDHEFDAQVVESIFKNALRAGGSVKDLCEIIKFRG